MLQVEIGHNAARRALGCHSYTAQSHGTLIDVVNSGQDRDRGPE